MKQLPKSVVDENGYLRVKVPLKESKLKIGDKVYYRDCIRPFTVSNLGSKGFETVNDLGLVSGSDDSLDYSLTIQ